jgi:hypothetical protein
VLREARKIALVHAWRKHRVNFITLVVSLIYYIAVMREQGEYGRGDLGMWLLLVIGWPVIILMMIRDFLQKLREVKDKSSE